MDIRHLDGSPIPIFGLERISVPGITMLPLAEIRPYQNMGPDRVNAIVKAVHNAETYVLYSIGGWGNHKGFSNAISPENRQTFVENIISVMQEWGFDGIDFYGYVWQGGSGTDTGGVTRPNQRWRNAPVVTDNVPYHEIMDKYYEPEYFHWDEDAQAAYLSIDRPGSSDDLFISFEEEKAVEKKIKYALKQQLGGVFIWELAGGYQQNKPPGRRDLLLRSVKETVKNADSLISEIVESR